MAEQDKPDLAAACASLTDGQRRCLRLVRQHKTSKEIARILGISRFTVDQRVERACQMLGAGKRTEAALILEKFYDWPVSERFVYEQPDIVGDRGQDLTSFSTLEGSRDLEIGGTDTAENGPIKGEMAGTEMSQASRESKLSSWFWETYYPKGDPDAIPPKPRVKWIIQLMIQILVSILILVAIGQVLSTFAHRLWPVVEEPSKK